MTVTGTESELVPLRVSRPRSGRLLAGVCAGLDGVRGVRTIRWRIGFLLAALCAGIGIVAYLGCWLIIPDTDETADSDTVRGVVVLAWACGGFVAVVLSAGLSAVLTVFGLGWVMLAIAGAGLALALTPLATRVPGIVVFLAVAALTLPAIAVALSPVRISLQDGALISRPVNAAAVDATVFHSGFGSQLIDLRGTNLPDSGSVTLAIDAGVRRTIVALPYDQCVHVRVNYAIHPFVSQLATLVSGHQGPLFQGVVLFGRVYAVTPNPHEGTITSPGTLSGPTVTIDFTSQGGSLYVRDYPNDVAASADPNWPGFAGRPEPYPLLRGEPPKVKKTMLADWHQRRRAQIANEQIINARMPGPCAS